MKHRDPSIRACHGPAKPLIVRTQGAPSVTTHRAFYAGTMPFEAKAVEPRPRLPGGEPPEPYRNAWKRAGLTGRGAREPFNSKQAKGEYYATKAYLEGDPPKRGRINGV